MRADYAGPIPSQRARTLAMLLVLVLFFLIVRTDESLSSAPTIGATLYVTPRPDRLHWFDAATVARGPLTPQRTP